MYRGKTPRIPLYIQIRDYIQDGIATATWKQGAALPSENELAAQFNVSRLTIKHALETLVEEGTIYRIQGKGTFISEGAQGEPARYQSALKNETPDGQSAAAGRPGLLGYIVPRLNNMFMCNILSGIEREAARKGYRLVIGMTHDSQRQENDILRDMIGLGVQGLLLYPVEGELYSEAILRLILDRFPIVMIDRYLRGIDTFCVCSDNNLAGRQAAEHLVGLGHTKIAFVSHGLQGTSSVEDRLAGYEAALREAGIHLDPRLRLLTLKTLDEANVEEIRDFLAAERQITAVIAVNSAIGRQVLAAAAELGLKVPEDLSVVIFDNHEALPYTPTHIKQREDELASESIRLLLTAIRSPDAGRQRIELPTLLIEGATTGTVQPDYPNRNLPER